MYIRSRYNINGRYTTLDEYLPISKYPCFVIPRQTLSISIVGTYLSIYLLYLPIEAF